MPAKRPRTKHDSDLTMDNLSRLFADEDAAREFLESKRWPNGPVCPRCDCTKTAYAIKPTKKRTTTRKGLYKCPGCRKQFTVRIGSVLEESRLPLRKWLMAFHLMASSKKGISSHQLARELDITVKTAWFLSHRIRESMKQEPLAGMIGGKGKVVEADETYVGGKPRPQHGQPAKRGRGTAKKPVLVLVERDGKSHAQPIDRADAKTVRAAVRETVDLESTLSTDEWASYRSVGREFTGGHVSVNHAQKEYVRHDDKGAVYASTNEAESWFSLLKRSHYGVHHQMSKRHLHRYCNERSFMWNHRKVSDGERMVAAVKGAEGKRLYYREPTQQAIACANRD